MPSLPHASLHALTGTLRAFAQARRQLLLWLALAAAVLAGLIAWELRQSHLAARDSSQRAAQMLSLLLKEQLDGAFRETDLVLRDLVGKADPAILGRLDKLSSSERAAVQNLLDEKLPTLPQVDTLAFLSHDGRWVLSSERLQRSDGYQRTFYRQLYDNPGQEMVFSPPVRLPGSHDLGFVVARRIAASDGSLAGIVFALIRLEYFTQLAGRLDGPDRSAFALVDNDLVLVARYPESAAHIGKVIPSTTLNSDWVNGRSNGYLVFRSPYDGVDRGVSFRRLENFPFIVLVGLPESAYFQDWQRKAFAYVGAYLLLVLFGLAMAWRGWREAQLALAVQASAARLQEQDAHILRALETISRPIMLVRADGDIILNANQAAAELYGRSAQEMAGMALPSLYLRPEHHTEIVQQLAQRKAVADYELKFRKPDGETFWVGLSGSVIEYRGEAAYFLSLQNISERKAAQETLWRKATIDPLTGISNRGYFLERAEQEWFRARRYQHRIGLLMLDIDHFKQVNDTHGHDAGDHVLQGFVSRIRRELRETDIFGRLGGEEFGVLLVEDDDAGLPNVAERLRAALAATPIVLPNGVSLTITVSIGCATGLIDEINLESLLKQADQALYAAKRGGRNQVVCADPLAPVSH